MASLPHPSLIVRAFINDRELTPELVSRIKTTYSYIGSVTATGVEPEAVDPESHNVLQLDIRLHRPYWDGADPVACTVWDDMMECWLANMFYKVSETVANAYTADEERDGGLAFRWIELKFGANVTVAFEVGADDLRLPVDALETVRRVRSRMASGELGGQVACVRVPRAGEGAAGWTVECSDGTSRVVEAGCSDRA